MRYWTAYCTLSETSELLVDHDGGREGLKWTIWPFPPFSLLSQSGESSLGLGPYRSSLVEHDMSPWPRVNQLLGPLAFHTIA